MVPNKIPVIGTPVSIGDKTTTLETLCRLAARKESHSVVLANVHVLVTARIDKQLRQAVQAASFVLPDGAPVAWCLRRLGYNQPSRIAGPDLMWMLLEQANQRGLRVYFYGSTPSTLKALQSAVARTFPDLALVGCVSPPFGQVSADALQKDVLAIKQAEPNLVFVGLGCPKQEIWMHRFAAQIPAVTLGVGAAFDFHAGTVTRAPQWMRTAGLEWLFRLISEPGRLWRRYLFTNSAFMALSAAQIAKHYLRIKEGKNA
jgi:N-acetylglucosaminyldiphosphoundecaprenol N-acetyl-beta-D-mannosaminyltransferase